MWWIAVVIGLVVSALALTVRIVTRRAHVGELGRVSDRWMAQHRADAP